MNTAAVLGLSLALSVGAAATTAIVLMPAEPAPAGDPVSAPAESGDSAEVAALRAELEAQAERQESFEQQVLAKLDALGRRPEPIAAELAAGQAPQAGLDDAAEAIEAGAELTKEEQLTELLAAMGDAEWEDQAELWTKLKEADLVDEALAYFREQAELNPDDAEAQFALGGAYLQAIQVTENDMLKGQLATGADKAFDAVLELDENHLDARRAKAISLSFWPPIFGKTNEAKQQFETLIAKQLQTDPSPEHAEAYLWLGNLHLQTGDPEAAKQVWADGLSLFPDNAELSGQLDTSK
jgi:tetratricopeptide (TPR) repeat protein